MEKMAGAIKKLESILEGSGTMMDNTLIVYPSDAMTSINGLLRVALCPDR